MEKPQSIDEKIEEFKIEAEAKVELKAGVEISVGVSLIKLVEAKLTAELGVHATGTIVGTTYNKSNAYIAARNLIQSLSTQMVSIPVGYVKETPVVQM